MKRKSEYCINHPDIESAPGSSLCADCLKAYRKNHHRKWYDKNARVAKKKKEKKQEITTIIGWDQRIAVTAREKLSEIYDKKNIIARNIMMLE
jgi:hypothetical protein